MSFDSPAAILYDGYGHAIGVTQDGYIYRLQTESIVQKIIPTVSIGNSTTIPLLAGATFTGTSEDVSSFVSIDVTIISNQVSAVNGLVFQWSQDNIVFDYGESFTMQPNVGQFFSLAPRAKYFNILYVNGLTNQDSFSLSTVYYPIGRSTYVQNLDTDIPNQKAVEVVRSVMAAQKQGAVSDLSSNYTNLQATNSGLLRVSVDSAVFPAIIPANIIQKHNTGPTFATSISTTFASNVTVGNTIVIALMQGQGTSNNNYFLSDTLSNIYTKAGSFKPMSNGSQIDIWYAPTLSGMCSIVAAHFSNVTHLAMQAYEVSGIISVGHAVDTITASINNGTSLSVGPVITNANGEFCLAVYAADIATVISPGVGWSPDLSVAGFGCFSQVQSVFGSLTGTATAASSVNSTNILITFLPLVSSKPFQTDLTGKLYTKAQLEDDNGSPIILGQKTKELSVPVTMASNQSPIITEITDGYHGIVSVTPPGTPAMVEDRALVVAISPNNAFTVNFAKSAIVIKTNIASSGSSVILLPANMSRLGATIYNDSLSGFLYINLGSAVDASDFVIKLFPLQYYEIPFGYVGDINGCWSIINGFARIAEFM